MKRKIVTVIALVLSFLIVHLAYPTAANAATTPFEQARAVYVPTINRTVNEGSSFKICVPSDVYPDVYTGYNYRDNYSSWSYYYDDKPDKGFYNKLSCRGISREPVGCTLTLDCKVSRNPVYADTAIRLLLRRREDKPNYKAIYFLITIRNTYKSAPPVVVKTIPNQEARMERSFNLYIPGTFKDPEDDSLTYNVTGLPPGLSFSGNRIQGKPSPVSANKRSTVTVTAADPDGSKASTSFYITVLANKPPVVAKKIPNQEARMERSFNLSIPPGTFKDPDGGSLTYTVTGLPPGLSFSGNRIQGKPSPVSANKRSTVTVTAVDPDEGKASTSFYITVLANKPPVVAKPIPNQEARVGQSFNLYIPGTFKDPDGGSLTYTATGLPTGLSLSGSSIQGKPSPVKTDQSSTVTVTAVDPDDGKVSTSFKITVRANQLPEVAKTIPNQEAREGELFEFPIPSDTFKDPDGDSLIYAVKGLPKGLGFNSSNKKILGTPEDGTIGTYEVKVVAFDSNNGKASTNFKIQVKVKKTGAPPIAEKTIPNQSATEGQPFNFTIPEGTFTDRDGDTLKYEVQGLPDGLSFNPDTKEISGVLADGTGTTLHRVTVKVDDGHGNDTTSARFKLIVDSLADTKEDLTEEIAAAKKMLKRIESVRDKGFAIGLTFDSPQQPDDYLKFFSARDLDFRFNVFIPNPNPSPNCKGVRLGDPSAAQADIDVLTQYIAEQEKYLQSLPK